MRIGMQDVESVQRFKLFDKKVLFFSLEKNSGDFYEIENL